MKTHIFMDVLLSLFLALLFPLTNAQGPPSPGYWPGSKLASQGFYQGFRTLWGAQNQRVDQGSLTLWLDRNSGSGIKSINRYRSGYFGSSIKLQPGYTAGIITSFYLSIDQDFSGYHDEIDIEFLGTIPGKPYILQTNVYMKGSGDGHNIIGREMQFHLWFDPTQAFHDYAILWNPNEIIFFVDDVPIRMYQKKSEATFPSRPMNIYGSVWDASSWATDHGRYRADYRYAPFVGKYNSLKTGGCADNSAATCRPTSGSQYISGGLSRHQYAAMVWVQRNYLVYNYCHDLKRDRSRTPECYGSLENKKYK